VALIDLNLQFGDAVLFLSERRPASNVAEVAQQCHRLDASLLASSMLDVLPGLSVLAAPEDPGQATTVRREHVEAIIRQARSQYDVVILDVSHGLDPVSLLALDMADVILPVLQLTLPFIRGARHLLQVFRSLDYPNSKVRPIVNRLEKGGDITLRDLEETIGNPVFRSIPNSYAAVARSVNLGEAIVKGEPGSPVSKALLELGQALVPRQEQPSEGGWLSRVFGRR
jgi:pilus assembly protein CpaE